MLSAINRQDRREIKSLQHLLTAGSNLMRLTCILLKQAGARPLRNGTRGLRLVDVIDNTEKAYICYLRCKHCEADLAFQSSTTAIGKPWTSHTGESQIM